MRKLILTAATAFLSVVLFGQTLQDAQKLIDNESYFKAKQTLYKVLAAGTELKPDVYYYLGNAYLKDDDVDSAKLFYKQVFNPDTRTPLGYLANGRLALLNKNTVEAKQNFDRALQITKMKNANIYYEIGDAYFKPNIIDLQAAITNFEAAYNLDSKNTSILLELGDAYLENSANDPSMGGKAMNKYESASEINKSLPLAWIKIGRLSMRGRIYDQAIDAFDKALAIDPSYAVIYKELGEAYYYTKQFDKMLTNFKKYVALSPGDLKAQTTILEIYARNKEWDKVVDEANNALKNNPDNPLFLRYIFYGDYELKRYKDGYDVMTKYMQMPGVTPKPTDYIYAARLASQMNDTTAAFNYFNTALANDSTNCDLLSEFAKTLFLSRNYTAAISQYEKKKAACGDQLSSLEVYYLGRAYYSNNDFVKADTTFAEFAERNPTSPDGYFWRARSNVQIGKPEDFNAYPFYQKYIDVAGSNPEKYKSNLTEAYLYLGVYSLEKGKDKAKAKEYFNKVLELDPNDANAAEFLKQL